MGKRISNLTIEKDGDITSSTIIVSYDKKGFVFDDYETNYNYDVLVGYDSNDDIQCVEINNLNELSKVIDNEDCLPDIGLLDYTDDDLKLDFKDLSLRQLYNEILNIK